MAFSSHKEFMAVKKRKLDLQGQESSKKSKLGQVTENPSTVLQLLSTQESLFSGLVLHFDGHTTSNGMSFLELKESVLIRGGKVSFKLNSQVTHIIATRLTDTKIRQIKKPVVLPAWITSSIQCGQLLSWKKFQMPINVLPGQQTLNFLGSPESNNLKFNSSIDSQSYTAGKLSFGSPRQFLSFTNHSLIDSPLATCTSRNLNPSKNSTLTSSNSYINQNISRIESNPAPAHFSGRPNIDMNSEWVKQNSSTAPNFIQNYFGNSRLHHISTWKNDLKEFVLDHLSSKPAPSKENVNQVSIIMHVDMDCFFASIATRNQPQLKGLPVAIAHSPGSSRNSTSEIASCNYPARSFGIRNGMSIGKARTLCSHLNVLPYEFEKYDQASRQLYLVLLQYADDIQAVSCDEAFVDVTTAVFRDCLNTNSMHESQQDTVQSNAIAIAEKIRSEIRKKTQCNASIGISHNILLSRLATKKAKPNSSFFLSRKDIDAFMATISVRDLPGIGRQISSKLQDTLNIETCFELQQESKTQLQLVFGEKTGIMLYEYSRGIDSRSLENKTRQSIGAEVNWGVRFDTSEQVRTFLEELSFEVGRRLKTAKARGKMITLKVKRRKSDKQAFKILGCGDCDNLSRSSTLRESTDCISDIKRETLKLMNELKLEAAEIRGIGIHITKLNYINAIQPIISTSKDRMVARQPLISTMIKAKKQVQSNPSQWITEKEMNIDLNVFNELPRDIQQEFYHLAYPPETLVTPEKKKSGQLPANERPTFVEEDYIINYSQIDHKILEMLPTDYVEKLKALPLKNLNDKEFQSPTSIVKELEKKDLEPSASQMDPSVFNELPYALQAELRVDFKIKKNNQKPKGRAALPKVKVLDTVLLDCTNRKPVWRGSSSIDQWRNELKVLFTYNDRTLTEELPTFGKLLTELVKSSYLEDVGLLLMFIVDHPLGKAAFWSNICREWVELCQDACIEKYGKKMKILDTIFNYLN